MNSNQNTPKKSARGFVTPQKKLPFDYLSDSTNKFSPTPSPGKIENKINDLCQEPLDFKLEPHKWAGLEIQKIDIMMTEA